LNTADLERADMEDLVICYLFKTMIFVFEGLQTYQFADYQTCLFRFLIAACGVNNTVLLAEITYHGECLRCPEHSNNWFLV
jgi:hypothetical protein